MGVQDSEWAQQRGRAIAAHSAERARKEAAEAQQAEAMLLEFVQSACAHGVAPVALVARSYDGRHRYKTGLRGWYLTVDERLAVAEGGQFYILSVRGSIRERLTGTTLTPVRPRLIIGEGGRDGDRIALRALLERRLAPN